MIVIGIKYCYFYCVRGELIAIFGGGLSKLIVKLLFFKKIDISVKNER